MPDGGATGGIHLLHHLPLDVQSWKPRVAVGCLSKISSTHEGRPDPTLPGGRHRGREGPHPHLA